jgi:hypothetical protein
MRLVQVCVVVLTLAAVASAAAGQAGARHWPGAVAMAAYDYNSPTLIRGFVDAVDWSGPTTWISVRQDGTGDTWKVEAAAPSVLKADRLGEALVPGARIVVQAYAARAGGRRAAGMRLTAYKPEKLGLEGHVGPVTDQLLASYAARPWSRGFWSGREVKLGLHNGAELVADHPCSHLCPPYTVRVIHYAAEPGPQCDSIGGVVQRLQTQFGSLGKRAYCVPKILVERGLQVDRRVGFAGDVGGNPGY